MPNILVLSGSPTTRWYLIALADAISHGKGFLTVAMVVPEKLSQGERTETMVSSVQKYLKDRAVPALVKIQTSDNVFDGLCDLVKTYGLGPVVPNTILLGETEKGRQVSDYVRLIQIIHRSKRNLVIVRENDNPHYNEKNNRIDLWWQKESTNSGFMLALAYLLQQSPEWNGSEMIFHSTVENETDSQEVLKGLKSFAQKSRLEDYQIVTHVRNGEDTFSIIRKESEGSNLVFLGMRSPDGDIENTLDETYYQSLMKKTDGMPPTAIVLMAENMEFDRIFDES